MYTDYDQQTFYENYIILRNLNLSRNIYQKTQKNNTSHKLFDVFYEQNFEFMEYIIGIENHIVPYSVIFNENNIKDEILNNTKQSIYIYYLIITNDLDQCIYELKINELQKNHIYQYCKIAILYGRDHILNYFLSHLQNTNLLHKNNDYLFRLACRYLSPTKGLSKFIIDTHNNILLTQTDLYKSYIYDIILISACKSRNEKIMDWILQLNVIDYSVNIRVISAICFYDLDSTFKSIENRISDIHFSNEYVFRIFCKNGNIVMAKYLYNKYPTINIHAKNEYAFRKACEYGYLELSKWLYEIDNIVNIHICNDIILQRVCENGHLNVLHYLIEICDPENYDIHLKNEHLFRYACYNGHYEIVKYLNENFDINIHILNNDAFLRACERGHLNIVKYIDSNKKQDFDKELIYNCFIKCFSHPGHIFIDIAKYLYYQIGLGVKLIIPKNVLINIYLESTHHPYDICTWTLIKIENTDTTMYFPLTIYQKKRLYINENDLESAINNHILYVNNTKDAYEWIQNICPFEFDKQDVYNIFEKICNENRLSFAKEFYINVVHVNAESDFDEKNWQTILCSILKNSIWNKNIKMAEWIFTLYKNYIDTFNHEMKEIMYNVCFSGNISIYKYIVEFCESKLIDVDNPRNFYLSCTFSHFELAKYIFEHLPIKIKLPTSSICQCLTNDNHDHEECDIIYWIIKNKHFQVFERHNIENIFIKACEYGNYKFILWILNSNSEKLHLELESSEITHKKLSDVLNKQQLCQCIYIYCKNNQFKYKNTSSLFIEYTLIELFKFVICEIKFIDFNKIFLLCCQYDTQLYTFGKLCKLYWCLDIGQYNYFEHTLNMDTILVDNQTLEKGLQICVDEYLIENCQYILKTYKISQKYIFKLCYNICNDINLHNVDENSIDYDMVKCIFPHLNTFYQKKIIYKICDICCYNLIYWITSSSNYEFEYVNDNIIFVDTNTNYMNIITDLKMTVMNQTKSNTCPCIICNDIVDTDFVVSNCKHQYCIDCFVNYVYKYSNEYCAMCRQELILENCIYYKI